MKDKKGYDITKMLWILKGRMTEGVESITITKKEEGRYEFSTTTQRQQKKSTTKV